MVYDYLVAAIRTQGGLYGLSYGTTCFNVADYSTIFGLIAGNSSASQYQNWMGYVYHFE